jgi:hypothetical protein
MIWGLALAAIAAVFVGIATLIVVTRTRRLSSAQDRLSAAKDSQLALDLRDKDVKIAEAQRGAIEAKERAAALEVEAAQLKRDNLTLEAELSPRLFKGQHNAIEKLKMFAGTPVVLEYVLDLECKRLAEQIAFVLTEAKWPYSPKPNPDPDMFFSEGVHAGANAIAYPLAGQALIDELNKSGVDAALLPLGPVIPPEGSILIRVGMKPSPQEKREAKPIMDAVNAIQEAIREGRPAKFPDPAIFKSGRHFIGNRVPLPNR